MYNTHCEFNKETGQIEFIKLKWYCSIKALTKITLKEDKDQIELKIYADSNK